MTASFEEPNHARCSGRVDAKKAIDSMTKYIFHVYFGHSIVKVAYAKLLLAITPKYSVPGKPQGSVILAKGTNSLPKLARIAVTLLR